MFPNVSSVIASPVIAVSPDVNPVAIEAAVRVGGESAASPDPHGVHVVPVAPVGREPPEPQLSYRNDELPASTAGAAVVTHGAGRLGHHVTLGWLLVSRSPRSNRYNRSDRSSRSDLDLLLVKLEAVGVNIPTKRLSEVRLRGGLSHVAEQAPVQTLLHRLRPD